MRDEINKIANILENVYTSDDFAHYSDEGVWANIPNVSKNKNLNFYFYRKPGFDTPEFIEAVLRDDKGVEHRLMSYDFMYDDVEQYFSSNSQRLKVYDKYYDVDGEGGNIAGLGDMADFILKLQQKHYFVSDEGKIYYLEDNQPAQETGFESHFVDSDFAMFKDSFAICKTSQEEYYLPVEDCTTTLYKRSEDGKYTSIWKTHGNIFQKEGFPDNVYFSGSSKGSWQFPKAKAYFVDGKIDDKTQKQIENLIFSDSEAYEQFKTSGDYLQLKMDMLREKLGNKVGKTADVKKGKDTNEHRETANAQVEISKAIMKARRAKEGKGA